MVDKVWYDWQNANPANGNSFAGGSVQAVDNVTIYEKYPTGAPPYLTVSFVWYDKHTSRLIHSH